MQDIDLPLFWAQGKRGIILDVDNTVAPWDQDILTTDGIAFIESALHLQYRICLISNASRERTEKIARRYNFPFIAPALKPFKKPFLTAISRLELTPDQVLVIGDQIFTDIVGGNRTGCFTILVSPVGSREFIGTKFMRLLEIMVGRKN